MVLVKTLIFTVLVPGMVAGYIPYQLLSSASVPPPGPLGSWRYGGLIPVALGVAIYLWCAWDFTFAGRGTPAPLDPPKELVVRGLYRYARNPMYVGVLSVLLGEALLFESRVLWGYAGLVFAFFYLFIVIYEEPALRRKFGDSYRRYCQAVPRWVPRLRRSSERGRRTYD